MIAVLRKTPSIAGPGARPAAGLRARTWASTLTRLPFLPARAVRLLAAGAASLCRPLAALLTFAALILAPPAGAADRDRIAAFVAVTGYDVAIEGLRHAATIGPGPASGEMEAFGRQYAELAGQVFDVAQMQERALDILAGVLPDNLLHAGAEFYASDLGQKLVAVENDSHLASSEQRQSEGSALTQHLIRSNPDRIGLLIAMHSAIGSEEVSRRAVVEIQLRFIMAAIASGAMEMQLSEDELRARLMQDVRSRADEARTRALINSAWTYRDIEDADLAAYVAALETPELRGLYEVLNAVQYQVMIERYEVLGARLAELTPERDL